MKKYNKILFSALFIFFAFFNAEIVNAAQAPVNNIPLPSVQFGLSRADSPADVALTLQILALMTVLSLVPAILLMLTSFTRIIIVLGFVQSRLPLV